jgi:hypothetical protein
LRKYIDIDIRGNGSPIMIHILYYQSSLTEFESILQNISNEIPGAVLGRVFGAQCIKSSNGKACAIYWKDGLMFRLDKKSQQEALALEGATIGFHLYATERPMKGWVWVPPEHFEKWKYFTLKALEFIENS